jgi:hypothetical protein
MELSPLVPELVTLHVWRVPVTRVPHALTAMARDRRPVAQAPGHTFHKLLGTGDGRTFTVRDGDLRRWALLVCWSDARAAATFEHSAVVRRWDGWSAAGGERFRVAMTPLTSKGWWDGRQPFGDASPAGDRAGEHTGMVAALTRARLRPRLTPAFWRAVPPVNTRLHDSPGLVTSLGIGEAPLGRHGTFSLWESTTALTDFAFGSAEHRRVIAQTRETGWYSEELFARFAVVEAGGWIGGQHIRLVT